MPVDFGRHVCHRLLPALPGGPESGGGGAQNATECANQSKFVKLPSLSHLFHLLSSNVRCPQRGLFGTYDLVPEQGNVTLDVTNGPS